MRRLLIWSIAVLLGVLPQAAHAHKPGGPWRWLGVGWGDGYHAPPCHTWGHSGHCAHGYASPWAAPCANCQPLPYGPAYSQAVPVVAPTPALPPQLHP